jgi:hypothetical protein
MLTVSRDAIVAPFAAPIEGVSHGTQRQILRGSPNSSRLVATRVSSKPDIAARQEMKAYMLRGAGPYCDAS